MYITKYCFLEPITENYLSCKDTICKVLKEKSMSKDDLLNSLKEEIDISCFSEAIEGLLFYGNISKTNTKNLTLFNLVRYKENQFKDEFNFLI